MQTILESPPPRRRQRMSGRVTARLPESVAQQLEALAIAADLPSGALVRQFVIEGIEAAK